MMRRSRIWIGGGIILVLLLALGFVLRAPLLEAGLRAALAARGLSGIALRVEHLGWKQLEIRDLDYAGVVDLQARSILIEYEPLELLTGRLRAIEIAGARLRLDLTEGMPSLGGTGDGGAPPLAALPSLRLTDAEIELLTTAGEIVGPIHGRLESDQVGALHGSLAFQLEGAGGRILGTAEGRFTADRRLAGTIDIEDGEMSLPGPAGGFVVSGLSGHGDADWSGDGNQGLSMALSMAEATLAGASLSGATADVRMRGARLGTMGALSLSAKRVAHGDLTFQDLRFDQELELEASGETISLTARDDGVISATNLQYRGTLAVDGPLVLHVQAKAQPLVVLQGSIGRAMTATFDVLAHADPTRMTLTLGGTGKRSLDIDAKNLRIAGSYASNEGIKIQTSLDGSSIALPEEQYSAHGISAQAMLEPGQNPVVRYTIGTLTHDAVPPLFAPLSVSGRAALAARSVDFSTEVTGADASVRVTGKGKHSLETGQGHANLRLAPLDYRPGGAQPGTLLPSLADLKEVSGHVEAQSALTWAAKGLDGTASFRVSDLSFQTGLAQVQGLSLDLDLDKVLPPSSPPGQSLRIARIDPGVPIDDLTLTFQLLPGKAPTLLLEQGAFRLAGGVFRLSQVTLDPVRDRQELPFQVQDLDLSEVFALLGVEGLSGTGRLDGPLPVQILAGRPKFVGGRLVADAAGHLQIRSERVRQALGAAGESADLLLRALEDFRYQELSLTIDQPSNEAAILGLSILGHNPAVLEGYPFRININLETNPEKLLGTLQEAYSISGRAMRQMWMFGR
jgi:hypothetical protein